jgi:cytoskeleton protein RodZ
MVVPRAAGDFGSKLRAARERRGLSLRQIANATKISMMTLEALERNDLARLPGGMFSRAFVRSYALEVGLDPDDTIQEFMGQFPHDSVTGHPTTTLIEDHEAVESDRRMATTFLRLFMISVTVAGFVLYFGTAGRRASPLAERQAAAVAPREIAPAAAPSPDPAAAATAPAATAPAATAPAATTPAAPAPAATTPADRLTVQVTAAGRSWVSAIVDGRRGVQRIFQPGDEQTFEVHHEIVLTTDDAGAVTVTLNGAATRPLGKSGQIVTTRVNLMNFKDYLLAP